VLNDSSLDINTCNNDNTTNGRRSSPIGYIDQAKSIPGPSLSPITNRPREISQERSGNNYLLRKRERSSDLTETLTRAAREAEAISRKRHRKYSKQGHPTVYTFNSNDANANAPHTPGTPSLQSAISQITHRYDAGFEFEVKFLRTKGIRISELTDTTETLKLKMFYIIQIGVVLRINSVFHRSQILD
jgi:hypothetical protein